MRRIFHLLFIAGVFFSAFLFLAIDAQAVTKNINVTISFPYGVPAGGVNFVFIIRDNNTKTVQTRGGLATGAGIYSTTANYSCKEGTVRYEAEARYVNDSGDLVGGFGQGGAANCEDNDPINGTMSIESNGINPQNAGIFGCLDMKGEPVNVTNGNMYISHRDYLLNSGVGESIGAVRNYNSMNSSAGLFGTGWSSEFEETLSRGSAGAMKLKMADGKTSLFVSTTPYYTDFTAVYGMAPGGVVFDSSDWTHTLTHGDGSTQKHDWYGRLLSRRDRNANQTTYNYTSGVLTSVTDPFGRSLTFTYGSNGKVSQLTDATGTVADYEYFSGTTKLKTVTYPDGSKYKFEYTDITIGGVARPYLTTVKDALDNIIETHAYDSAGRATTSEVDGGVEEYTFDYSNWTATVPYTVVTDALGRVEKYYFDRTMGRRMVTKTEGVCGCGGSGSEVTTYEYDYKLNIVKKIDALLNETVYTYDAAGNLASETDVRGTESYNYNSSGDVIIYRDRMGGGRTNTYSSTGNLLAAADGLYPSITWTGKVGVNESPTGTITRNTNSDSWGGAGAASSESLSGDGRMLHIVGQTGKHRVIGLGYVDSNQSYTDVDFGFALNAEDNHAYIYENGTYISVGVQFSLGTILEIERVGTTIYYKKNGTTIRTVTSVSTSALYVDTSIYSNGGEFKDVRLIAANDTSLPKTTYTYTTIGLLASVTDARNKTSSFTYDTSGRMTKVTDADSNETAFAYNARAQVTSVTNALNQTTAFEYDDHNRLEKITYPDTNDVVFEYDLAGRRTSVTDELNHQTTYAYDDAYRLISISDPLSHTTSFGYDLMSNMTSQTDALGNVTNLEYDDFNRLKKIKHPLPSPSATPRLEESFTYDKLGNIKTKVDTGGRTTSYDYDAASRLTKITDALSNETQFTYNARSQTTKVTDELNQEYTFTYDPQGRMLTQTRNGTTMTFTYDAVGNRITREDYKGDDTTYTYDNLNRLTAIAYAGTSSEYATYTYDDLSRLLTAVNQNGTVTFTYNNRGSLATEEDVFGHDLEYTYDAAQRKTLLKLDTSNHTAYAYDNANRLTTLTDESSSNFTFAYDNANKLTSRVAPNGVTSSYEYDGMSRLKRLKHYTTGSTLYDDQFTYNTANQISQIAGLAATKNYTYDNINRLTAVAVGGSNVETYAYDAVGNRTSSHLSSSYTTSAFNRLTATSSASYTYNANGSMTGKTVGSTGWTYGWDRENRTVSAGDGTNSASYQYDALGRRAKRTHGTTIEKFTHDAEDVVLDDINSTLTKYQNGPGIDNKLSSMTTGTRKYLMPDHLGSTIGLASSSGSVTDSTAYDSFGNPTNYVFPTRYRFTGREFDSVSGNQYYRARFFDANLGRFQSEDPIGFGGGDVNLYGYVKNQPLNFRDPLGLNPGQAVWQNPNFWKHAIPAFGPVGAGIAAGGAPAIVAVGGFGVGYGIGYYPGQWLASWPRNPVVYGPLNPFGTPPYPISPPRIPIVRGGPTCGPRPRAIPFTRTHSDAWPVDPPNDREGCAEEIANCHQLCERARYDPDYRDRFRPGQSIWGGSYNTCMSGCISERCKEGTGFR